MCGSRTRRPIITHGSERTSSAIRGPGIRGEIRIRPSVRYSSSASSIACSRCRRRPPVMNSSRWSSSAGVLLDAARDLGVERVVEVVDEDADGVVALAREVAGDRVRAVAEPRGRVEHERAALVGRPCRCCASPARRARGTRRPRGPRPPSSRRRAAGSSEPRPPRPCARRLANTTPTSRPRESVTGAPESPGATTVCSSKAGRSAVRPSSPWKRTVTRRRTRTARSGVSSRCTVTTPDAAPVAGRGAARPRTDSQARSSRRSTRSTRAGRPPARTERAPSST